MIVKIYLPTNLISNSNKEPNKTFHLYGKFNKKTNETLIKTYSYEKVRKDYLGTFIHYSNVRNELKQTNVTNNKNSIIQIETNNLNEFKCKFKTSQLVNQSEPIRYIVFLSDDDNIFPIATFNHSINHNQETISEKIKKQFTNWNRFKWMPFQIQSCDLISNLIYILLTIKYCLKGTNELRKRARLYSLALNFFLGFSISLIICINPYFNLSSWLNFQVYNKMEKLMLILTQIINWLMGVPVGLKLNKPLNEFLGRFFMYHIYLWNSSLDMFKLILPFLLKLIIYSGFIGLSFSLSAILDVIKILTIHQYCFYVYALRIYKLEMESLKSLFRLFRGKKLNPLRLRIDSYSYNIDQLFIGTLSFCISFFLLPTIVMYYIVFLSLRLLIMLVYLVMKFFIVSFNNIPLYELVVYFIRTSQISHKIKFTVLVNEFNASEVEYSFIRVKKVKLDFSELLRVTECDIFKLRLNKLGQVIRDIINGTKL